MSTKDPFADIISKYFKCKKLLKTAEERLFKLDLPMEDLTEHETQFNQFKRDLKQLNFAEIYSKRSTNFGATVNRIHDYFERFFTGHFPDGQRILDEAGGSDDEQTSTSQKGLKDILNNIKTLEKRIGSADERRGTSRTRRS